MGNRQRNVLDWTDQQERAAVNAALPGWQLAASDVIFCMSWYEPGYRKDAALSAPLTVQVRRAGLDLAVGVKGVDFDEQSFTAPDALELIEGLAIGPWPQLEADLAEAEGEPARLVRLAQDAKAAAAVYAEAAAEAVTVADEAAVHAEEHPDEDQLQQVAEYTAGQVQVAQARADDAAAVAVELAEQAGV